MNDAYYGNIGSGFYSQVLLSGWQERELISIFLSGLRASKRKVAGKLIVMVASVFTKWEVFLRVVSGGKVSEQVMAVSALTLTI